MVKYKQSAAIPYRINDNKLHILLITSRNGKRWIIPKGLIENGDRAENSAEREAVEEAGVVGKINNRVIGEYTYKKWAGVCTVKVFPMQVIKILDAWDEQKIRSRKWYEAEEAIKKVKPKSLQKLIKQFVKSHSS